ncbi:hypothetical protein Hanom_Chr06g00500891 [Helianthus anomalus]
MQTEIDTRTNTKHKTHNIHRLTPLVLIRMKGSITSSMSTNQFCKLSKCVCVHRMLSLSLLCLLCVLSPNEHTAWVFIPITDDLVEGSGLLIETSSIDHNVIEGSTYTSKDGISFEVQQHPSWNIFRAHRRIDTILR